MIFKKSWLNISDGSNVKWVQTFHLYCGFYRKKTQSGFFIKSSVRLIEPPRIEYKGFKIKYNKKGDICKNLIVRTNYYCKKKNGFFIFFKKNNSILIKKKYEIKSKYLYGPIFINIKRKKLLNLYKIIF